MAYPKTPVHGTSGRPGTGRPAKKNYGWGEEQAEKEIVNYFKTGYVSLILELQPEDYNDYIDALKRYVRENVRGITTSQLRNVFFRIGRLRDYRELMLLRPKLAYVSGRSDKPAMKTLLYLLDQLIVGTDSPERLRRLKDFFEAVVAYHKYYEKIKSS